MRTTPYIKEIEMDTKKIQSELKRFWNEKPLEAIVAGAAVLTAGAKVVDSISAASSRRAYARQVNNSIKMQSKKRK